MYVLSVLSPLVKLGVPNGLSIQVDWLGRPETQEEASEQTQPASPPYVTRQPCLYTP